jgi:hypothetical protein
MVDARAVADANLGANAETVVEVDATTSANLGANAEAGGG